MSDTEVHSEDYTETNDVELTINIIGDTAVFINGEAIIGDETSPNQLSMTLAHDGDVMVTINGEDFMVTEDEASWVEPRDNRLKPPPAKKGKHK